MSTNDEDRLRLMSPEEIAAAQSAHDEYDADADNKAAERAIGRGDLDADAPGDGDKGAPAQPAADQTAANQAATATGAEADKKTTDAASVASADDGAAGQGAAGDESASLADLGAPATAPAPQAMGYKADLPADFAEQLKANKDAQAELRKKFNDGDLDQAEYDTQLDALQDARDDLRDQQTRAKISAEMTQQNAENAWVNAINTFVADAASKAELGIVDYSKDTAKQTDLDAFVKALANTPGNEGKPHRWYLEEAHKRVVALHGIPTTKKAPGSRKPDVSEVTTTLAEAAGGATDADPSGGEFAELDKLKGADYESALAALRRDPAKYQRYLRS